MTAPIVTSIRDLRKTLNRQRVRGSRIGFVPTMGYLHDGHASLMRSAAAETDFVVASIFVNPLQFAPEEDLSSYPRDIEHDQVIAAAAGVDLLFVPTVDEMYPGGPVLTTVSVGDLSERWDGRSRPTHFSGVATVVTKLFNVIGPCRAYFGEKDYQQLAIVCRMVADLSSPVDIVGCPIVRETDGVAMSSRNAYLEPAEREAATVLSTALRAGRAAIADGETDPSRVAKIMEEVVAAEPLASLDYAAVVDPLTLREAEVLAPVDGVGPPVAQLLIAAHVGGTRLIDNAAVGADPRGRPWAVPATQTHSMLDSGGLVT